MREGGRERGRKERKVMDMNAEREGRTRKHEGGSRRVPVPMVSAAAAAAAHTHNVVF